MRNRPPRTSSAASRLGHDEIRLPLHSSIHGHVEMEFAVSAEQAKESRTNSSGSSRTALT